MTFRVSLLFQADAKAAKAEVDGLAASARKVGDASQDLGRKALDGARGVDGIARAADGAEAQLQGMTAAQQTAAASATQLARGHTMAAGATGNLVAQFNDIGMMLAAGQNPLQLAIQQGTQITQVIGPMGAAGAASALGSAFVGMLSPINLITIGGIAAGAAMIQWLTGAGEAAVTADEALETMRSSADAYTDAIRRSRMSTAELREEYGAMAEAARANLEGLAMNRREQAMADAAAIAAQVTGGDGTYRQAGQQAAIADRFDLAMSGTGRQLGREMVLPVIDAFEELDRVANGTLEEQIASYQRVIEVYTAAADAQNGRTELERTQLNLLHEQLAVLLEIQRAEQSGVPRSQDQWQAAADAEANAARVAMLREVQQMEAAAAAAAADRRAEDQAAAEQLLTSMSEQATLANLIATYGAESAEVAAERAVQERRAFEEMLATSTASEELKEQLRLSFDIMQLMAGADFASPIAAARGEAALLAEQLGISVGLAERLSALDAPVVLDPRDPAYDEGAALREQQFGFEYNRVSPFASSRQRAPAVGGGSPGGGGAARVERDAVQELITSLREELDILRETDPVQQELLRHRETLADATEAERAEVAALIAARETERDAAGATAEMYEFLGRTGKDSLMGIASGAQSLEEAARNAAGALAEAVLQGALLGEGPFGGVFGGTSVFSLLGGAMGIPAKAKGGMIHGPGDGTSDDVLMWGSAGEFVATADATARYRPILEAMNAGAPLPGYARGGMIGGGGAVDRSGGSADRRPLHVTMDLQGARGDREIEAAAYAGMQRAIADYDREVLPLSMRRVQDDPWRTG
jgi:hypothetical protein